MSALGIIDKQVLKLVDYLIELHEETGTNLDLVNETAFGIQFYPSNRHIITHMRGTEVKGGKGKSAPHLLIFNLGKRFNIDFNFFYDDSIKAEDAFQSKHKNDVPTDSEDIQKMFDEMEKRVQIFVKGNQRLTQKEAFKFCNETEIELLSIQSHIVRAFSPEFLDEQTEEILEAFNKILLLATRTIDNLITIANLDEDIDILTTKMKRYKADKTKLEGSIQKLNKDLAECNKSLLEAKNGETDALKQLLAIKSKN